MMRTRTTGAITLLLAVVLGLAIGRDSAVLILAVLAAVGVVWGRLAPRAAYLLAIWVSVLRPYISISLGVPREIALIADVLVLSVLVRLLLRKDGQGAFEGDQRTILRFAGGFVLVAVMSSALNGSSIFDLLGAIRALLLGPAVLLVGISLARDRPSGELLERHLLVLLVLQIVFALFQIPGAAVEGNPDLVVGTLGPGGANVLGLLCLVGMVYVSSLEWLRGRWAAVVVILLVIPIVFSSSRFAILLLPAVWLLIVWKRLSGVGLRVVVVGLAGVVTAASLVGYSAATGRDLSYDFSVSTIVAGQLEVRAGNVPRLAYLKYIAEPLESQPWGWLVGLGPGQFASGYAIARGAPRAATLVSTLRVIAVGYTSGGYTYLDGNIPVTSQVVAVVSEYGVVGFLLYIGLIGSAMVRSRRIHSAGRRTLLVVSLGLTAVASVWANLWELQAWALVWAMAATSFARQRGSLDEGDKGGRGHREHSRQLMVRELATSSGTGHANLAKGANSLCRSWRHSKQTCP